MSRYLARKGPSEGRSVREQPVTVRAAGQSRPGTATNCRCSAAGRDGRTSARWRLGLRLPLMMLFLAASSCSTLTKLPKDHWWRYYREGRSRDEIVREHNLQLENCWNFYFRGALLEKAEAYEDAVRDFDQAIGKREADQRNMRSYGMHFLDYFPHREMGICLFHLKRLDEAEKELRLSLKTVESVRGKRYLKALLRTKVSKALPQPAIKISAPERHDVPTRETLVKGTVEAPAYLDWLSIGGVRRELDLPQKGYAFSRLLALADGANRIELVAQDLAGQRTTQTIELRVDTKPPLIAVFSDRCAIDDDTGVASVEINGVRRKPTRVESDGVQIFDVPSAGPLKIQVVDAVGNGGQPYQRTAPGTKPFVDLALPGGIVVHDEAFAVGGRAYHDRGVDKVLLNDRPVDLPGPRPREVSFAGPVQLQPGLNHISAVANAQGSEELCRRCVTLTPFALFGQDGRLSVSVMPPVLRGVPKAFATRFYEKLIGGLGDRFHVLNEDASDYRAIQAKLEAARLELTDQRHDHVKILRRGIVPGDALLFLILTNPEAGRVVDVEAHLLASETTQSLLEADDYGSQEGVEDLVERFCARIARQFPVVRTSVQSVEDQLTVLSAGEREGVRLGMPVCFYRQQDLWTGAETLKRCFEIPVIGRVVSSEWALSRCVPYPSLGTLDKTCYAIAK